MEPYLETNKPVRSQFRVGRRAKISGAIVIHTAESIADEVGPDSGAENVARFIQFRSTPGSYQTIVDSDSIVQLVDFDNEAYGEGTGGNKWAIHISVAMSAKQWKTVGPAWRNKVMDNMVLACAMAERHVLAKRNIIVPRHRITPNEYRNLMLPGYISHGDIDPARRSDPGVDFDWGYLFSGLNGKETVVDKSRDVGLYTDLLAAYTVGGRSPSPQEVDDWLPDLRAKLSRSEALTPTFSWIAHTVSKEGE